MSLAALWLFIAAFQATTTPPSATEQSGQKQACQVFGDVVQKDGGQPLKKAQVTLRPMDRSGSAKPTSQKTGEDGKFCFKKLAAGRYMLSAQRNGFVPLEYGGDDSWPEGTVLALEKDQKLARVILRLVRASVITGKVVDEDGEAAPGVLVQILAPSEEVEESSLGEGDMMFRPSKSPFQPAQVTVTNDLGEFRVAGLAAGKYFLEASDTGGRMSGINLMAGGFTIAGAEEVGSDDEYAPTYYPGTTRADQASAIELAAGQDANIDLQLQHEKMVTLGGIIVREDGKPASGASIRLSAADESFANLFDTPFSQTEADGRFSLKHVLAGSYTLEASFSEESSEGVVARQKIEVAKENISNLRLVLRPGLTVTGRITFEGGSPEKSLQSWVVLQSKDSSNSVSAASPKDGEIKLTGLEPGSYWVAVMGLPEEYYLKRVTYGSRQSSQNALTIPSDSAPEPLELLVSAKSATLEGTVQDSAQAPVGGAIVTVRAASDKPDVFPLKRRAVSDQNGKFYVRGLPPGEYRVTVRKGRKAESDDSAQTTVDLSEGEKKSLSLTLGK